MTALLVTLTLVVLILLAAVVALGRDNRRLVVYRESHPHTNEDLAAATARSVRQSRASTGGSVQEHLAALLPAFGERFNFREAHFIGQPIDYIVFDGLEDPSADVTVHIVEVKTGGSDLSPRQRRVRNAVLAGRVNWALVRLDGVPDNDVPDWPRITTTVIDPDEARSIVWDEDD